MFERLGRFARVIRFDRRDTGVSDPIRDDLTLEAHVADALAVIDAGRRRAPGAAWLDRGRSHGGSASSVVPGAGRRADRGRRDRSRCGRLLTGIRGAGRREHRR